LKWSIVQGTPHLTWQISLHQHTHRYSKMP
jgi:hypothetical protein